MSSPNSNTTTEERELTEAWRPTEESIELAGGLTDGQRRLRMSRSTYRLRNQAVWRYEGEEAIECILDPGDEASLRALQGAYNRGDSDGYRDRAREEWDRGHE